jgi:VanZ family protein
MRTVRLKTFWLVTGFGFIGLVVFLSLAPDPPDTGLPQGMKIGHVLAYFWLMYWFGQIYRSTSARYRLAGVFCMMGALLEYAQGLTDYRGFEYSDMLINAAGVVLGLLVLHTGLQNMLMRVEGLLLRSST